MQAPIPNLHRPYNTLLVRMIAPALAIVNLERMRKLSRLNDVFHPINSFIFVDRREYRELSHKMDL